MFAPSVPQYRLVWLPQSSTPHCRYLCTAVHPCSDWGQTIQIVSVEHLGTCDTVGVPCSFTCVQPGMDCRRLAGSSPPSQSPPHAVTCQHSTSLLIHGQSSAKKVRVRHLHSTVPYCSPVPPSPVICSSYDKLWCSSLCPQLQQCNVVLRTSTTPSWVAFSYIVFG